MIVYNLNLISFNIRPEESNAILVIKLKGREGRMPAGCRRYELLRKGTTNCGVDGCLQVGAVGCARLECRQDAGATNWRYERALRIGGTNCGAGYWVVIFFSEAGR